MQSVRPNLGVEAAYKKQLDKLIKQMHRSVLYWMRAGYKREMEQQYGRRVKPLIVVDAVPARMLQRLFSKLAKHWQGKFDAAAEEIALKLATGALGQNDASWRKLLRKAGWTVKFKMTPAMRDIFAATVQQNVSLIKSIPQQYLKNVEGAVMRSVQVGGDVGGLVKELQENYGVSKRRAKLISVDQNRKAAAAFNKVRQLESGIKYAIWHHSHAGKTPRPEHVKMNGKKFDVAKGMYDPVEKKHIQPGELINCLPGSTKIDFANDVEIAYRHWYSGELTKVVMASGKTLRLTPNHPVLTPQGWRPAKSLKKGGYVVQIAENVAGISDTRTTDNVNDAVTSIDEIFAALRRSGVGKIAEGGNFHGDLTDSDVDVVFAARPLSFDNRKFGSKSGEAFRFGFSYDPAFGLCSFQKFFTRSLTATTRFMRGFGQSFAFAFAGTGHTHEHCFAAAPDFTPGKPDTFLDRAPLNIVLSRECQDTRASFMFSTQLTALVDVVSEPFEGHVFNLQTKQGAYIAESLIVHNCRCFSTSLIPGVHKGA